MRKILIMTSLLAFALSCTKSPASKILVLYYSQTSNTKAVAEEIAGRLGADLEEIVPVVAYDGEFKETIDRCLQERETGTFPEVQPLSVDLKAYDIIFLGYPVWFGTYARPVEGFLETVDLNGKTIVPFCTFGSGGLDSSVRDLKEKFPDAEILPGYGVRAARIDAVPAEIDRFLKEGGFIEGEYEKYDDFPAAQPATEEEAAIFDAAVAGYPMLNAKAENVSSRAVTGGTEYLFEARDIPREPDQAEQGHLIKVYVLCEEGKAPVFTQVLR
ncbi:MAG: NAD(P)H-dependent oxidoreductase [Bacteroidales bacterium]|nr:NAD(P)H-dependent oxidoreductase [Bacteroidales bacterium]